MPRASANVILLSVNFAGLSSITLTKAVGQLQAQGIVSPPLPGLSNRWSLRSFMHLSMHFMVTLLLHAPPVHFMVASLFHWSRAKNRNEKRADGEIHRPLCCSSYIASLYCFMALAR